MVKRGVKKNTIPNELDMAMGTERLDIMSARAST